MLFTGDNLAFNTTNTENGFNMKSEAERKELQQMVKVHDILEMWQGSQHRNATQKESRTQTQQMSTVGYISDTEEIFKPS
jgi:hypothetical protein